MSPPKLIDCITLALGRVGSSLLAVVEVAGHDLCMFPYRVGELHSGPTPKGCPSKLNFGMVPVVATQASRGSRGWHAAIVMS